jgi:hypothetical protein
MASMNKCLAVSNKSGTSGETTKRPTLGLLLR